jgi:uncharacterized protein (DUF58 family)
MAYLPFVPPGTDAAADLELRFDRRGCYREDSFGLATCFPFAFFTKTRHVALRREVIVYPRIDSSDQVLEVVPLIRGDWESFIRGRGSELYRIREYMPEDSARHVDWKATAKSGSLKVREFARDDERRLSIVFDNPQPGLISDLAYERAVDLTASLAWHFASQETETTFIVPGRPRTRDLHEFLGWMATVKAGDGRKANEDPLSQMGLTSSDDYNIVVTARGRGSLPLALWNSSYFVFAREVESVKRAFK